MTTFCVAAAQTVPQAGDWQANLVQHLQLAQLAAQQGVRLLVFPELSLVGYELHLLQSHAISLQTPRLDGLHEIANSAQMTIVVGAPLRETETSKPFIASIVLHPTGLRSFYAKYFLHAGEEEFAQRGKIDHAIYSVDTQRIALAICADTTHAAHPAVAVDHGAQLYAASVLWSVKGYAVDAAMMQSYAQSHGISVLAANFAGESGGYACAGASALWNAEGQLVAQAPANAVGLLCAQHINNRWQSRWIHAAAHVG
jgi:predicted amidohydrolase